MHACWLVSTFYCLMSLSRGEKREEKLACSLLTNIASPIFYLSNISFITVQIYMKFYHYIFDYRKELLTYPFVSFFRKRNKA